MSQKKEKYARSMERRLTELEDRFFADVHTEQLHDATKKETLYIQVKYTIGKAANEEQPNLAKLSEDLWKTLSNWSKLISDPAEARSKISTQKLFISQIDSKTKA